MLTENSGGFSLFRCHPPDQSTIKSGIGPYLHHMRHLFVPFNFIEVYNRDTVIYNFKMYIAMTWQIYCEMITIISIVKSIISCRLKKVKECFSLRWEFYVLLSQKLSNILHHSVNYSHYVVHCITNTYLSYNKVLPFILLTFFI